MRRISNRRVHLVVTALAMMCAAMTAAQAAPGVYCPNPGLDCNKVLVVPIKYVGPVCPDPTGPCPVPPPILTDPPRITAYHLIDVLNDRVNPHLADWSFGTFQFQFDLLANPDSPDGWWPMPVGFQEYYVSMLAGADLWLPGAGERAIMQDAIEGIAAEASMNGLIPSLATYNRFLIVDNNHERGGQQTSVQYRVPVFNPLFGWVWVKHLFTGSWSAVDVSDDAMVPLVSHELMHQLGPGDFYGDCPITETPMGFFVDECNGPWDVLALDMLGPSHPTAYNKVALGWLPDDSQHVETLPVPGAAFSTSADIHPIETIDATSRRLLRIPFAQTPPGSLFEGYQIECRRYINGDEVLPQAGVLIQLVREAKPQVDLSGTRPARVIRTDESFSLDQAALQPGGTWVDAVRGIQVHFPMFAGPAPDAACRVNVDYAPAGAKPDPLFVTIGNGTADLWMDSMQNGTDVYPFNQPLDGDGVPTGAGDPFAPGKFNILRFRVHNLGTAPTPSLAVRLIAEQPPYVTCGGNPPRILDKIRFVDPIPPGEVALDGVNIEIPDSHLVRVRAEIMPITGEMTTSNNKGERTFSTGANSAVLDLDYAEPVTLNLAFVNACPLDQLLSAVPMTMPVKTGPPIPDPIFDRWRVTDPGLILVGSGEQVPMQLTFVPPSPITPGSGVTIPISFQTGGGLAAAGGLFGESRPTVDSVDVTIPVVEQATIDAAVSVGPHSLGSVFTISGTLAPASSETPFGLVFVSPEGTEYPVGLSTDGRGVYSLPLLAPWVGAWSVTAQWQGDDTRSEAQSPVSRFVVVPDATCLVDPECNDGNPCTMDSCDRSIGRCQYVIRPDGTTCDDGDRCTAGNICTTGGCGQRVTCNDSSVCTSDSCDPVSGMCRFDPLATEEVAEIDFVSASVFQWTPTSQASYWNSYRGTIPRRLLGTRTPTWDETCLESGDTLVDGMLMTTDLESPVAGEAFYYQVSERTLCGEGPVGTTPTGDPRAPSRPCPSF